MKLITADQLREYAYLSGEIETIEEQIETIGAKIMAAKPPKLDGMPHSETVTDGADLIVKYIELQELMQKKLDRSIKLHYQIDNLTDALPSEERIAVRYKYLHGMTVAEIARKMNYSERQIQRIVKSGVERMLQDEADK